MSLNSPAPLQLKLISEPAQIAPARKKIEAFADSSGFDDAAVGDIGLCFNEAIANVIRHAYRGRLDQPVEVCADLLDDELRVSIRDWGDGDQPGPLPTDVVDPTNPGGLGLVCLGRLMDKVTFTPQKPGMLFEMFRSRLDR